MCAPEPAVSPSSPIDQLSSLLALSQQIRSASHAGQPLSRPDLISKLDAILPSGDTLAPPLLPSASPSYSHSTPNKHHNELMLSMDSGLALTGSFSSLYESDESLFSPHPHSRANRSLSFRTPTVRNPRNDRNKRLTPPQQEDQMSLFLQTVSSEFSTSLRALLDNLSREEQEDKKRDELTGSGSDVTLTEFEQVRSSESPPEDVSQLIQSNAQLVSSCKRLRARVREERREGKRVLKENTSLLLEREGLLSKMSETEKEIIEKLSEHVALTESYSTLEERLKEREREQRETRARIASMETEVNKLTDLLSRVEQDLSESTRREGEFQRENSHLYEELVIKEKEVIELRSAAQRVESHARLLSALGGDLPSSHDYTGGVVSTDEILRGTVSLCEQLNSLIDLFSAGPAHCLSQIRAGLSHALADGNILLQNISALKGEHERCKEALNELQLSVKERSAGSEDLDILTRIAEMAPRIKLEAEQLAGQWNEPVSREHTNTSHINSLILSHLRELLSEFTGADVTNESLISTLSGLLTTRNRDLSQSTSSLGSESSELEGRLQESSQLLSGLSEALGGERAKRRSQVRALRKKVQRDEALIRNLQLEREQARGAEQAIRQEVARLSENLQESGPSLSFTEPCVRELAQGVEGVISGRDSKKLSALKESLEAAYSRGEKTIKLLEWKLSENEELNEQVRQLSLERVRIAGVNAELRRCVVEMEKQLIAEREESQTRENLLRTKLQIAQQHIQQYDDVMFAELDKLFVQIKDESKELDLQERKEEKSADVVKKMREEIDTKQDDIEFLEREVTMYKVKLLNLEKLHGEELEKLKQHTQQATPVKEQKVSFCDSLPEPTPLTLSPMTPLRGEELRTALGVALTQEQLYAKAHLSLQTERDELASENKRLGDRINSLYQRLTDPTGILATQAGPDSREVSSAGSGLERENALMASQLSELTGHVSRLAHYRGLYYDSKRNARSLIWQKSYLKSQLNVYFSSLRASALILGDLGIDLDKIGLGSPVRRRSKFRVYAWVAIFVFRLSSSTRCQQNILYLNYAPTQRPHTSFPYC